MEWSSWRRAQSVLATKQANKQSDLQIFMLSPERGICFAHSPRVTFRVTSKLTNSRADNKFGGENSLAEGHLRMVQPFKKHLHTSFANPFLIDTDG
jgi:hypothetical protein